MAKFFKIHVGASVDDGSEAAGSRLSGLMRGATAPAAAETTARMQNATSETAGRLYLQTFLEDAGSEELLKITSPDRPQLVPDMRLESVAAVPALSADNVAFQQTFKGLPVFSGRVTVDVDSGNKQLVAINGNLSPAPDISPLETVPASQALEILAKWLGVAPDTLSYEGAGEERPQLTWYLDEQNDKWHLVHHLKGVPAAPRASDVSEPDHPFAGASHFCVGHSPRSDSPHYDYMVDAHTGDVRYFFASSPHLDIPAPMKGEDSGGTEKNFFGLHGGGTFFLSDPIRKLETYDLAHQDLDAIPGPTVPGAPISNPTNDLGSGFPAAVAAHHNAMLVYDFFNNVLKRDSVDDKGMTVVSIVNAYASSQNPLPFPQWRNAVWWQQKMWYGEVNGTSLAENLDVIAHELTHGVTESSSNLIYRDLPGALNESFSDIFGVIIANWYPSEPEPLIGWDWRIGAGLAPGGGPLRDFANPANADQPDHFSQYVPLPPQHDNGGVHIYSGIHNRAVHLLITNRDANGDPTFPLDELVLLLYLTLTRLTQTSDFSDCRRTLEIVVRAFHISDPVTQQVRLNAVDAAYGAVGIV